MSLNLYFALLLLICLSQEVFPEGNNSTGRINTSSESVSEKPAVTLNKDFLPYQFYDGENNLLTPDTAQSYFIVIRNNKSCLNCFYILEDYLFALDADSVNDWMINSIDSSTLSRRRIMYESKQEFRKTSFFGITYHTPDTMYTPVLLLIKHAKLYQFSYKELFNEGVDYIGTATQDKIKKILQYE